MVHFPLKYLDMLDSKSSLNVTVWTGMNAESQTIFYTQQICVLLINGPYFSVNLDFMQKEWEFLF